MRVPVTMGLSALWAGISVLTEPNVLCTYALPLWPWAIVA